MTVIVNKRALLIPLTSCGIAFFLGVEGGGFQLVLLKMAEEFSLDPVRMGVVVSSQYAALFLGPLLFGWVSDRVGKKTVLFFSMFFFIAGCFGAALSGTVKLFSIAVFVIGLGFSVSECISSSFLSDSFPGKESSYLNIMQSCFSLGAVLSPLVFSRLMHGGWISWRAVFASAGAGFLLVYPLLVLSRTSNVSIKNPETKNPETNVGLQNLSTKAALPSGPEPGIFSPFFFVLILAIMISVAVEAGIGFFADSLFVTAYGNNVLGAYAISGFWFFMAISRFIFSWVKTKPETMVMTGFLLVFVLLVISLPLNKLYAMFVVFFLLGFATGPVWPMLVGIGASLNQRRSGTIVSILIAFGGLGGGIVPVLVGLVAERHGFYSSYWLLPAFSALGFLIMYFGIKKLKRQHGLGH